MKIGYARVSTDKQDEAMQVSSLKAYGCDEIYIDHGESGSKRKRPQLDAMLQKLKSGDTVVVWKYDRMGRNTSHLLLLLDDFNKKGITFVSTTQCIDTSTSAGKMFFTVVAGFAEFERDQIAERTRDGIRERVANGVEWNSWKRIPDGQPISRTTAWRRKRKK